MSRTSSARAIVMAALAVSGFAVTIVVQPGSAQGGLYTSAQAARGEMTYMNSCVGCHPKGTYTAPAFRKRWNGQPASELFEFLRTSMPKEQPGVLEPEEYAQVIAYMMKINGAPAGAAELPADAKALKKIRISMPK